MWLRKLRLARLRDFRVDLLRDLGVTLLRKHRLAWFRMLRVVWLRILGVARLWHLGVALLLGIGDIRFLGRRQGGLFHLLLLKLGGWDDGLLLLVGTHASEETGPEPSVHIVLSVPAFWKTLRSTAACLHMPAHHGSSPRHSAKPTSPSSLCRSAIPVLPSFFITFYAICLQITPTFSAL